MQSHGVGGFTFLSYLLASILLLSLSVSFVVAPLLFTFSPSPLLDTASSVSRG